MVAGLAHEINTPLGVALTAISHLKNVQEERFQLLASGLLRKSDFEDWKSENTEGFSLVVSSLERAARLVKSLKQVSVDQASERRRQFSLSALLEELRLAFFHKLKRSPHRFETECAEDIQMDSYPGALFQVLSNLVENAISHAFSDGKSGRIRIEAKRQGDSVQLLVSDDGVGMTPEVAAQAFEPFFSTAHDRGGTGLGLHLVYSLSTVVLGGEIELETAPGKGTRFYLTFPSMAPVREKA
jgi:signal transduction histidine kinase